MLSLSIKKDAGFFRRVFDLHRVFGFYSFIVLFILSISGIYLALPSEIESVLGGANRDETREIIVNKKVALQGKDLESIVRFTSSSLDNQFPLKSVWMPNDSSDLWRITYVDQQNIVSSGSEIILWVNNDSGALQKTTDYSHASATQKFLRWQLPLHSGKVFGFWGRLAVFLAGLVPLLLFVTGLMIWRRKAKAKLG
jgi:uncharacterized iron-regulated membrane protein